MIVKRGDYARIRGGDLIWVSSAVDQEHPNVKENPDDIFLGYYVKYSPVTDSNFIDKSRLIVNTMAEVVRIETGVVVESRHGRIRI